MLTATPVQLPTLTIPDAPDSITNAYTVESPDGAFVVFSRRSIRQAMADAINDARRIAQE